MLEANDIDAHRVIHPASPTIVRLPCRLHKTGIMGWVLLALGLAMVLSVVSPPAAAETKEVGITCDESPIQVGFETIADHCRKWIFSGRAPTGAGFVESEIFGRYARFEGGYVNIRYHKAGFDTFFRHRKLKKLLISAFATVKSSASDWGPKIDVIVQSKIFITRSFMSRNDSCVGFVTRWGFEVGGNTHVLVGYLCGADRDYRKEYIASFLSQIQITRPIPKAKHKSPDAYRIAIFPFAGYFQQSTDAETADSLETRIQREPALAFVYSDYDSGLNEPRIKNPRRLWVRSREKLNLDVLYTIGRERDLNGIVMVSGAGTGGLAWASLGTERMPITLYLIDVDRRQVYRRKGTVGTVKKMSGQVFADFIKGRGAKE